MYVGPVHIPALCGALLIRASLPSSITLAPLPFKVLCVFFQLSSSFYPSFSDSRCLSGVLTSPVYTKGFSMVQFGDFSSLRCLGKVLIVPERSYKLGDKL